MTEMLLEGKHLTQPRAWPQPLTALRLVDSLRLGLIAFYHAYVLALMTLCSVKET